MIDKPKDSSSMGFQSTTAKVDKPTSAVLPSVKDIENLIKNADVSSVSAYQPNENCNTFKSSDITNVPISKNHKIVKTRILIHPDQKLISVPKTYEFNILPQLFGVTKEIPDDLDTKLRELGEVKPSINQSLNRVSSNDSPKETHSSSDQLEERDFSSKVGVKRKPISFPNQRTNEDNDFLSSRCDVVYKTILRDFRRYFQAQFKERANFTYRKKSKFFRQALEDFARELLTGHFEPDTDLQSLLYHLGSLV